MCNLNIICAGPLDLSGTSIPDRLLALFPSRLEQAITDTTTTTKPTELLLLPDLTSSSSLPSLDSTVSLCVSSPSNFFKIAQLLYLKSSSSSDLIDHHEFTSQLLLTLQAKLDKSRFTSLFPSPFHPLIHFTNAVSNYSVSQDQNRILLDQISFLLDNLYLQSELSFLDMNTVSFIVENLPSPHLTEQMKILSSSSSKTPYKQFPHLKRQNLRQRIHLLIMQ
jgi:hypothetical protein